MTALAAVATAAVVAPAAAAEAQEAAGVQSVVVEVNGNQVVVSLTDYAMAVGGANEALANFIGETPSVVGLKFGSKLVDFIGYATAFGQPDYDAETYYETAEEVTFESLKNFVEVDADGEVVLEDATPEEDEDGEEEVEGLGVETVTAIDKKGVTVTFPILDDVLTDVTIEVKDANGVAIAVKELTLEANEEDATFEFVNELSSNPSGVWTVEGIEFDVDVANQLAKINDAESELAFFNALKDAGMENLVLKNSPEYWDAEQPEDGFETLEEVQEFVNKVNQSLLDDEEVAEILEAIEEQLDGSKVILLDLLKDFERVNADYIDQYDTALADAVAAEEFSTLEDVQAAIDSVNYGKAVDAVNEALDSVERSDYNDAVKAVGFVKADDDEEEEETDKADLEESLALHNLVLRVHEASTNAQFQNAYNALVAYVDDEEVIGEEVFFNELRTEYRTNVTDDMKTAADIEEHIVAQNTLKRAKLYNAVASIVDAEGDDQTELSDVLNKLQDLAKFVDEDLFDISDVVTTDDRLELYREYLATELSVIAEATLTAIEEDFNSGEHVELVTELIEDVQEAIDEANDFAVAGPLGLIVSYSGDADDLLELLKNDELNLTNVVDANKEAYLANLGTLQTAAAEGVSDVKDVIEDINHVRLVANASSASAATTGLGYVAIQFTTETENALTFINLTSPQKLEVAGLFITDNKWGVNKFVGETRTGVSKVEEYNGLFAVGTDLEVLSKKYNEVLADINSEDTNTISKMSNALAALDYKPFNDLSAIRRIEVAEYVDANFPMTSGDEPRKVAYRTFADVQSAIDAAIEATK